MMVRHFAAILALACSACGIKGPLYLPPAQPAPAAPAPAPAAAQPQPEPAPGTTPGEKKP